MPPKESLTERLTVISLANDLDLQMVSPMVLAMAFGLAKAMESLMESLTANSTVMNSDQNLETSTGVKTVCSLDKQLDCLMVLLTATPKV